MDRYTSAATSGAPPESLRAVVRVVGPLAAVLVAVWLIAPPAPFSNPSSYLDFHTVAEIFTVCVALMVFAVGWNARSEDRPGNILLISCALLAGGLLDVGHLVSYQGMPDFITPADPQKAIYFWLAKQAIVGGGLLAAVWLPWRPFSSGRTPYFLLATSLALTALSFWAVLYHPQALPTVFVPGRGLTTFKIGMEYLDVAVTLVAMAVLVYRARQLNSRLVYNLLSALGVSALAVISFAHYAAVTDAFNFLGHLYLVLSYVFIYRAVFVDSIKVPMELLRESRNALHQSEGRFRDLVESSSEEIWEVNVHLVLTYISPKSKELLGYSPEEMIGKKLFDFMSADEAARFAATAERILATQAPFSYLECKKLHRNGEELTFEASGVPFYDTRGNLLGYRGVAREVTARKRADTRLRQWAHIFEHAQWGVAVAGRDGRFELMNPAFARMHGWSADELIGHPVSDVVAPEYRTAFRNHVYILEQHGGHHVFECRHIRRDGTVFDAAADVAVVRDENGEVLYHVFHVADISDQKRAENALRAGEERLSLVLESSDDVFWDWNLVTDEVFLSPSWGTMLGYGPGELQVRTGGEWFSLVNPDDVPRLMEGLSPHLDGQTPRYEAEYRMRTKPGEWLWTLARGKVVARDDQGRPLRMTGTNRDVQARRVAEEKLRKWADIFEHVDWGVVVADPDGRISMMNPAFASSRGYTVDDLVGRPVVDLFAQPFCREQVPEYIRIANEKGHHVFESRHVRKDGSVFPIKAYVTSVKDDQGRVLYHVAHVKDITEDKRAEDALRKSESLLAEAQQIARFGSWEWDIERNEFYWSDEVFRIFGRRPGSDRPTFEALMETVHPDDREAVNNLISLALYDRTPHSADFRIILPHGAERIIHACTAMVPLGEASDRVRVMGTFQDVTRRKRVESLLRAKEKRLRVQYEALARLAESKAFNQDDIQTSLRQITETAAEALDADHIVVWRCHSDHSGMVCLDRYDRAEGRHSFGMEISAVEYPGYCAALRENSVFAVNNTFLVPAVRELVQCCEGYSTVSSLLDVPIRLGEEMLGIVSCMRTGAPRKWHVDKRTFASSLASFVALVIEASETKAAKEALRNSEKRLRDITLMLGEGVYVLDKEGRLTFMNPEAERLLGWTQEESLGQDLHRMIHFQKEDRTPLSREDDPMSALIRYGTFFRTEEEVFTRKDGTIFPVSIVTTPLLEQGEVVGSVTAFQDISFRKLAEDELRRSRQRLRELSAFLQTVREEERTKISRDIHDQLGQVLTALKMDIAWVNSKLGVDPSAPLAKKTTVMAGIVDRAIETVRNIVTDLRPSLLDDLGLVAAIEWQVQEFGERTGIECHLHASDDDLTLESTRSIAIFRILQECLTNVAKHAGASRVDVSLKKRGELLMLEVRDNGRGFEPANLRKKSSFGVLGMKERALGLGGQVRIRNMKGGGTTVSAHVPLVTVTRRGVDEDQSAHSR
jgi:two-component system sensor histidine kinase UhpB